MADPLKLRVLKALTAHLQGITPANGYSYDLSSSVFRGRTIYGEDESLPMLSILESPRPDIGQYAAEDNSARKESWFLLLQGWDRDDPENPTDNLYFLMAAAEKRLAEIVDVRPDGSGRPLVPDAYMLGRIITGFTFGPGVVRPPSEGASAKAFFYLPLRVGLAGNVSGV